MAYQWLLFDADGTLFDYHRAEQMALPRAFAQMGLPFAEADRTIYQTVNAQTWLEFEAGNISLETLKIRRFERFFQAIGLSFDACTFSRCYLSHLAAGDYLIDGAEDLLRRLYGRFGLALITNGLKEVQRPRFKKSALSGYFSQIIISDEVGAAKPHPAIFDIAFEKMNNPAKEAVLVIGDSLTSDILGGYNYGLDTCWFNPTQKLNGHAVKPTFEIKTLSELIPLLDSLVPPG